MEKTLAIATRSALVLCTVIVVQVACLAEEYDVYLLAGQSNMDGRGLVSKLSVDQAAPIDGAIIFYRNESQSSNGWLPLAPGFSVPPKYKGGFPSPTFGPEIGFARSMLKSQPKRKLALIKGAKGGTNLRADWNPGGPNGEDSPGPQYRDFLATIRQATKQLTDQGDRFTIRGLLWHQGEADSKSSSEVYERRLNKLIAQIRKDVGVPDLPVVVGEVFDNGKRDGVRAAIQAVAVGSATVGLVSSKDTTTSDPGTHFDARSQLLLGKRYAEATTALRGLKRESPMRDGNTIEPTERDVAYGDHRRHKLHFWKVDAATPTAVAIHIHGGGWNGGERINRNLRPILPKLLAANISVVSVEYRLIKHAVSEGIGPPVKAPLHDCARAVQFVRSKAGEWNLDPKRVAVFGGSAGGCTSLWLAFHDDLADSESSDPVCQQSTRPNVVATIRPQTTLDPVQMKQWIPNGFYGGHAFGIISPSGKNRAQSIAKFLSRRDELLPEINRYSPYALATPDDPPVYLWYSSDPKAEKIRDPTHFVGYGVKLQERLKQLGVESELVYPGAPGVVHKSVVDYLKSRLQ